MKSKIVSIFFVMLILTSSITSVSVDAFWGNDNIYYERADNYVPAGHCNVEEIVDHFRTKDGFMVRFGVGDVNFDYKINIKDVTMIQKNIAKLEEFSITQLFAANCFLNSPTNFIGQGQKIDIKDATFLQKYIAGFDFSNMIDLNSALHTGVMYDWYWKPNGELGMDNVESIWYY